MRTSIAKLFMRSDRKQTTLDVDEELQFHVDMLEHKYTEDGMSPAQAKAAAFKRFGDLERVKRQCVAISRRNSFLRRLLKTSLILLALAGLAIHVLSSDTNVAHIGDTFVLIAIAGRLLLYVRGFVPSTTARNQHARN